VIPEKLIQSTSWKEPENVFAPTDASMNCRMTVSACYKNHESYYDDDDDGPEEKGFM
jgi:hypothetical protein